MSGWKIKVNLDSWFDTDLRRAHHNRGNTSHSNFLVYACPAFPQLQNWSTCNFLFVSSFVSSFVHTGKYLGFWHH